MIREPLPSQVERTSRITNVRIEWKREETWVPWKVNEA
jgi:hypothetical protein